MVNKLFLTSKKRSYKAKTGKEADYKRSTVGTKEVSLVYQKISPCSQIRVWDGSSKIINLCGPCRSEKATHSGSPLYFAQLPNIVGVVVSPVARTGHA